MLGNRVLNNAVNSAKAGRRQIKALALNVSSHQMAAVWGGCCSKLRSSGMNPSRPGLHNGRQLVSRSAANNLMQATGIGVCSIEVPSRAGAVMSRLPGCFVDALVKVAHHPCACGSHSCLRHCGPTAKTHRTHTLDATPEQSCSNMSCKVAPCAKDVPSTGHRAIAALMAQEVMTKSSPGQCPGHPSGSCQACRPGGPWHLQWADMLVQDMNG